MLHFTFDLVLPASAVLLACSGLEGGDVPALDAGIPLPIRNLSLRTSGALEGPVVAVGPRVLDHDPAGLALTTVTYNQQERIDHILWLKYNFRKKA